MAMTKDLISRITYHLSSGGLFNPELADHLAARNLLMECREALAQPEQEPDGVALTNIPHPNGAPAPDDLNADALEVVELELPDEDEAVGWADGGVINWIAGKQFKHASYLYATPPQRTWVGLTIKDIPDKYMGSREFMVGAKWAAKYLKEKNT